MPYSDLTSYVTSYAAGLYDKPMAEIPQEVLRTEILPYASSNP